MHAYMKNKIKQTKVVPGISRTTQKTFIITAVLAYVLQSWEVLEGVFAMPDFIGSLSRWFPVYLIDGLVMPVILFALAYVLFKVSVSKVSRIFKATLIPVIAQIISQAVNMLILMLSGSRMGLSSAAWPWSSVWMQSLPVIISVCGALVIAVYIFKATKEKEFTSSRKVQKIILSVVAFMLLAGFITWTVAMIDRNAGFMSAREAYLAYVMSALTIYVPLGILYLLSSKSQTRMARLLNAVLYMLIATFLSGAVFSLMYRLKIYMHEPGSFGAILQPILAYGIFAGIVVVQKLQKAF